MKRFKNWLFVILLLMVILISAGFSLWNTQPVQLSFGFVSFDPRPVSFWVVSSFVAGGVCGLVLGAGIIRDFKLKIRIRKLEKELAGIRQAQARQEKVRDETKSAEEA